MTISSPTNAELLREAHRDAIDAARALRACGTPRTVAGEDAREYEALRTAVLRAKAHLASVERRVSESRLECHE